MVRPRQAGQEISLRGGHELGPDEHVNWHIWGNAQRENGPLWRTFLAEQRALVGELDELVSVLPSVAAPVLLLADPQDTLVPVDTARRLEAALPDARLQLVEGSGHHLPRRARTRSPRRSSTFLETLDAARAPG